MVVLASAAGAGFAQESSDEDAGTSQEDTEYVQEAVIVSAQRREQSLQDVPASLTVFSAERLEIARIQDTQEIFLRTPNVSLNSEGSILSFDLGIRGVTNIGGILNSNAIYVDEFNITPLDISATASPELLETERVEVLRGPQGTLFGRNVSGGAISITTKKPSEEFEASLTGEYGNFDTFFTRGMLNVPLHETTALRLTGFARGTNGFIDDINPEGGTSRNDLDTWGVRGALRFEPNNRTTIDLTAMYRDVDQGLDDALSIGEVDQNFSLIISAAADAVIFDIVGFDDVIQFQEVLGNVPPGTADLFRAQMPFVPPTATVAIDEGLGFLPENQDTVNLDAPVGRDNELFIANANVNYQLTDSIDFIGSFGYFQSDTFITEDEDYTSINFGSLFDDEDVDSWSTEARLASSGDNRLDWTVGLIYAQDDLREIRQNELSIFGLVQSLVPSINANPIVQFLPGGVLIPEVDSIGELEMAFGVPPGALEPTLGASFSSQNFEFIQEVESFGLFGDASYELTDRLEVTLGARFSIDDVFAAQTEFGGFNPFVPGGVQPTLSSEGSVVTREFNGRFALLYDLTDNVNLYGSISRGTKPAGISLSAINANENANFAFELPESFDEEVTVNYELGAKGSAWNGRFQFGISAFYLDWSDAQVDGSAFSETFERFFFTQNIPSAESYGVEIDFTLRPIDGLDIYGTLGVNETSIGQFDTAVDILGDTQDITGNELPLAPNLTANLGAQYETSPLFRLGSLGEFTGLLQGEFIHRGSQFRFITDQTEGFPGNETPSYEIVNLRAGVRSERFELIGYVDNIADDLFFTGFRGGPASNGIRAAFQPRTYGVRGTIMF